MAGGGGREHALAWKIAADSSRPEVYCAPGNAGTAEVARNIPIAAEDISGIVSWARANNPDLVVVGPEAPLCAGLADRLIAEGIRVFGPTADAAMIEGSKVFSKEVMQAAGVPTAEARVFSDAAEAKAWVRRRGAPIVVKADGLAAGKGVTVCRTVEEAETAIEDALTRAVFGDAGNRVIVEECLEGEEASILALVDGSRIVMLASAQDHKRIFDGDRGPNTGGMGAYSPAPVVAAEMLAAIREQVFERTLAELRRRCIVYKGVLYAGLMISRGRINVLEFNCRFGDPETQAILPRWDGDILPALNACIDGNLREDMVKWRPEPAVCVVMASEGYPGSYKKGALIEGLDRAAAMAGVAVFHAGTRREGGAVVTSGGRVLGVTALGADLPEAVRRAYDAVSVIRFNGAQWRRDIAARALILKK